MPIKSVAHHSVELIMRQDDTNSALTSGVIYEDTRLALFYLLRDEDFFSDLDDAVPIAEKIDKVRSCFDAILSISDQHLSRLLLDMSDNVPLPKKDDGMHPDYELSHYPKFWVFDRIVKLALGNLSPKIADTSTQDRQLSNRLELLNVLFCVMSRLDKSDCIAILNQKDRSDPSVSPIELLAFADSFKKFSSLSILLTHIHFSTQEITQLFSPGFIASLLENHVASVLLPIISHHAITAEVRKDWLMGEREIHCGRLSDEERLETERYDGDHCSDVVRGNALHAILYHQGIRVREIAEQIETLKLILETPILCEAEIKKLVTATDSLGNNPIMVAVIYNDPSIVQMLLGAKGVTREDSKDCLMQSNKLSNNCLHTLMHAFSYDTEAQLVKLEEILKLDVLSDEDVRNLILADDNHGNNVVMKSFASCRGGEIFSKLLHARGMTDEDRRQALTRVNNEGKDVIQIIRDRNVGENWIINLQQRYGQLLQRLPAGPRLFVPAGGVATQDDAVVGAAARF